MHSWEPLGSCVFSIDDRVIMLGRWQIGVLQPGNKLKTEENQELLRVAYVS